MYTHKKEIYVDIVESKEKNYWESESECESEIYWENESSFVENLQNPDDPLQYQGFSFESTDTINIEFLHACRLNKKPDIVSISEKEWLCALTVCLEENHKKLVKMLYNDRQRHWYFNITENQRDKIAFLAARNGEYKILREILSKSIYLI